MSGSGSGSGSDTGTRAGSGSGFDFGSSSNSGSGTGTSAGSDTGSGSGSGSGAEARVNSGSRACIAGGGTGAGGAGGAGSADSLCSNLLANRGCFAIRSDICRHMWPNAEAGSERCASSLSRWTTSTVGAGRSGNLGGGGTWASLNAAIGLKAPTMGPRNDAINTSRGEGWRGASRVVSIDTGEAAAWPGTRLGVVMSASRAQSTR